MSGYRCVNYYELCRLCTASNGFRKVHIFGEEGRRKNLHEKIIECLPIDVRNRFCYSVFGENFPLLNISILLIYLNWTGDRSWQIAENCMHSMHNTSRIICKIPRNMHQCTGHARQLHKFHKTQEWRQGLFLFKKSIRLRFRTPHSTTHFVFLVCFGC